MSASEGNTYGCRTNTPLRSRSLQFEAWTPERPKLYPFSVSLGNDRVESYFAMRKITIEKDNAGVPRLFLNGKPYFTVGSWIRDIARRTLHGALRRSTHSGHCGHEISGFLICCASISRMEPLRFYYHCDRLGMLGLAGSAKWRQGITGS